MSKKKGVWNWNPYGSGTLLEAETGGVLLELIIRVDKLELIRKKGQKKGGWLSPPPALIILDQRCYRL